VQNRDLTWTLNYTDGAGQAQTVVALPLF
jgi:hypothetical protein